MQIDILGIQAFLAVVECGSFAFAASQLNLSQTAVSHRMRKLEETLGVQLLVRTTRSITLTDAGRALLPRARSAIQELRLSCESVRNHGHQADTWLSVACLPTVAVAIVTPLLRAARQAYPGGRVRVYDSSPQEIAELVLSRAAAFGISVFRPAGDQLVSEPIAAEPFVLVCPDNHALARRDSVCWADLRSQPLIRISLPSGNSMTIDDALGPIRETLDWQYEAQRNVMALEMVREGFGLTVVPRLSVCGPGLAMVPIAQPAVARTLVLLTRRDADPAAKVSFLRDQAVAMIRARLPKS